MAMLMHLWGGDPRSIDPSCGICSSIPSRLLLKWNHKLVRVERAADHKYDLRFTKAMETGFDLVIRADGAWSKV